MDLFSDGCGLCNRLGAFEFFLWGINFFVENTASAARVEIL